MSRQRRVAKRSLDELKLDPKLRAALKAAREQLMAEFDVDRLVLFGSQVSGQADEESDADVLVVLRRPVDLQTHDEISRIIFEINLEYDANLSQVVVDRDAWERGLVSALPIHDEVERTGVPL